MNTSYIERKNIAQTYGGSPGFIRASGDPGFISASGTSEV